MDDLVLEFIKENKDELFKKIELNVAKALRELTLNTLKQAFDDGEITFVVPINFN